MRPVPHLVLLVLCSPALGGILSTATGAERAPHAAVRRDSEGLEGTGQAWTGFSGGKGWEGSSHKAEPDPAGLRLHAL